MIEVSNVSKCFGGITALDNISLTIGKGDVVGILGRNGAGKTTLMRVLTAYLPPSAGVARVCGMDVTKNPREVRWKIGYLPEHPPLYLSMTVEDYLRFAADIKDVPVRHCAVRVDKVLEDCDLAAVRQRVIGTLSKGYQQRIGIAQALIHDPEVLILDEPTNGLDPIQILHVRKLIRHVERERTVIISTHILSEVEHMADRVIILRDGAVAADQVLRSCEPGAAAVRVEDLFLRVHDAEAQRGV